MKKKMYDKKGETERGYEKMISLSYHCYLWFNLFCLLFFFRAASFQSMNQFVKASL